MTLKSIALEMGKSEKYFQSRYEGNTILDLALKHFATEHPEVTISFTKNNTIYYTRAFITYLRSQFEYNNPPDNYISINDLTTQIAGKPQYFTNSSKGIRILNDSKKRFEERNLNVPYTFQIEDRSSEYFSVEFKVILEEVYQENLVPDGWTTLRKLTIKHGTYLKYFNFGKAGYDYVLEAMKEFQKVNANNNFHFTAPSGNFYSPEFITYLENMMVQRGVWSMDDQIEQ